MYQSRAVEEKKEIEKWNFRRGRVLLETSAAETKMVAGMRDYRIECAAVVSVKMPRL
jgi:hypothetical protein